MLAASAAPEAEARARHLARPPGNPGKPRDKPWLGCGWVIPDTKIRVPPDCAVLCVRYGIAVVPMEQLSSQPAVTRCPDAGRYEMLGRLASGGMATVYLACHRGKRASAALRRQGATSTSPNEEFVTMQLTSSAHRGAPAYPNVVPIVDMGSQNGTHYVVMDRATSPSAL